MQPRRTASSPSRVPSSGASGALAPAAGARSAAASPRRDASDKWPSWTPLPKGGTLAHQQQQQQQQLAGSSTSSSSPLGPTPTGHYSPTTTAPPDLNRSPWVWANGRRMELD